ncbi:pseudaminic acid cytidylyltransferase [Winogradskyella sp. DF17]|uniref:Pseudaminic acid cytidylyltransferase n=1 Tax=Winogradskyella pelagia TaxID=2819984 RepID=A0ABS3SYD9_9FLAO|nr:pseudaminic acid cytidylyltransferase [Winogradskyella sp. DF17]MBO3115234.1 pseudaminic acid cytidylyltransferase [Winogradskyella sp. DF17]
MRNLAIIPARGGSKRIPRKNIKNFLEKPIISYPINTARNCQLFDRVIVSTDDEEIAELSKRLGAEVPFLRSSKNSDDFATTVDVLLEVIENVKQQGGSFDSICCIYPTAPFVTPEKLNQGLSLMLKNNFEAVFPVLEYSFPIQRAVRLEKSYRMRLLEPDHINSRSQDLEPTYHDAGQFYWIKTQALLKHKKLWVPNTGCIIVDELEAQDIDTHSDWTMAEIKYKLMMDDRQDNTF